MKRIAAVLVLLALTLPLLTAAGGPGSSSDPLISQSFLEETFVPQVEGEAQEALLTGLDSEFSWLMDRSGLGMPDDSGEFLFASALRKLDIPKGSELALKFGARLIMTAGQGYVVTEYGTFINVSEAAEYDDLCEIELNRQYFVPEESRVTFRAEADCTVYVSGDYKPDTATRSASIYNDVSINNWYYDSVRYVQENRLFYDVDNTSFRPLEPTDRATIVYAMWVASGRPTPKGQAKFEDMTGEEYCSAAVSWASENNIVVGFATETGFEFKPANIVTREQIAVFMRRYADFLGRSTTQRGSLAPFTDRDEMGSWALSDLQWAVGSGLLKGVSETRMVPKGTCNRAQMATIIRRFITGEG